MWARDGQLGLVGGIEYTQIVRVMGYYAGNLGIFSSLTLGLLQMRHGKIHNLGS